MLSACWKLAYCLLHGDVYIHVGMNGADHVVSAGFGKDEVLHLAGIECRSLAKQSSWRIAIVRTRVCAASSRPDAENVESASLFGVAEVYWLVDGDSDRVLCEVGGIHVHRVGYPSSRASTVGASRASLTATQHGNPDREYEEYRKYPCHCSHAHLLCPLHRGAILLA